MTFIFLVSFIIGEALMRKSYSCLSDLRFFVLLVNSQSYNNYVLKGQVFFISCGRKECGSLIVKQLLKNIRGPSSLTCFMAEFYFLRNANL